MAIIETSINIAATPSRVWQVLLDFPGYPEWNPFIRSISGSVSAGRKLKIRVEPPGRRAMSFRPVILVADPERELRWRGKVLVPGIFDGEHYFRLEPHGSGTRLVHGEGFTGILLPLMRSALRATEEGFRAMNEALKKRAEA